MVRATPGLPSEICAARVRSGGFILVRCGRSFSICFWGAGRLEMCAGLDGAELTNANHGARDRRVQADWVGHKRPNVRMSFDDQWNAFDGRSIGALAALAEARFEQRVDIFKTRDALAVRTFAAEIVLKALAIGCLGEHARQSKFAHAARTGEEQSALGTRSRSNMERRAWTMRSLPRN